MESIYTKGTIETTLTAQNLMDIMHDPDTRADLVGIMLWQAKDAAVAHTSNAALRIVKSYLDALDFAVGIDTSVPHTHGALAMLWLRRQYLSDKLEARIEKEALAELLEGIL